MEQSDHHQVEEIKKKKIPLLLRIEGSQGKAGFISCLLILLITREMSE